MADGFHLPHPWLVAFKSVYHKPVKPTHWRIRAFIGMKASVDQPQTTGAAPRIRREYLYHIISYGTDHNSIVCLTLYVHHNLQTRNPNVKLRGKKA